MTFFVRRMAALSLCALGGCLLAGTASAGDSSPPNSPAAPDNARCSALGEGFFAVSGSDACVRISGYVAAGAEFGGGARVVAHEPEPFEGGSTTAFRTRTGVAADTRFDTPMGPGRLYIGLGSDNPFFQH